MSGGRSQGTEANRYQAYGLTIEVPFVCEDLVAADAAASVDVVVEDGVVPQRLHSPSMSEPEFDVAPGSFLWRGESHSCRFLVQTADRVVVERGANADDAMLALDFSSIVLAAVLARRGMLVLHGNSAAIGERAVLVCGQSGAGKSTTLAALLDRGLRMLSDDVSLVRLGDSGRIEVVPGPPRMHLTDASASAFGIDVRAFPRRRYKAVVSTTSDMAAGAFSLGAVYVLMSEPTEGVSCTALAGAAKFEALLDSVFGPVLPDDHAALFPLMCAVIEQVAVFELRRPDDRWSVDQVVDCIFRTGGISDAS